jgi:hypothetical protein
MSIDPRTLMDAPPRPWVWTGGYPQAITAVGPATLVANTFHDPDSVAHEAELICAAVNEYEALVAVAESAICRRFTMVSCRERPEVTDYCETCRALARLDEIREATSEAA